MDIEKDLVRVGRLKAIYRSLIEHYDAWTHTGEEPVEVTQEMRRTMDLQERRLKRLGLQREMSTELKYGKNGKKIYFLECDKSEAYDLIRGTAFGKQKVTIRRGPEIIETKRHGLRSEVYIMEIGNRDLRKVGKSPYSCPNCGAVSTVETLQTTGCGWCGSRFVISDLFPKVVAVDYSRYIAWRDHIPAQMLVCMILFALWYLVGTFRTTDPTASGFLTVWLAFRAVLKGGFYGLLFRFAILFVQATVLVIMDERMLRDLGKPKDSDAQAISNRLKRLNCDQDAMFLEIGRLRDSIIFADDPMRLTRYEGPPLQPEFSRIAWIEREAVHVVKGLQETEDKLILTIGCHLRYWAVENGVPVKKKGRFYLTAEHGKDCPFNPGFSIRVVTCASCGGSFDALTEKHCPYCGTEYDMRNTWVITGLWMD